jgi:hypothetical protein
MARRIRCRGCKERFWTVPVRPADGRLGAQDPLDRPPDLLPAGALPQVLRPGFFAADDENGSSALRDTMIGGPDDSHYELSAVFGDDEYSDDSQVELPAFSMGADSPDQGPSAAIFEPAGPDALLAFPPYYDTITSWGRFLVVATFAFAVASLLVLGYLLVRSFAGGPIIEASITALLVGCVGTIAFLLVALPLAVLVALLVDLGKTLRHLNLRADGNLRTAGERTARNRPNLSRSIG